MPLSILHPALFAFGLACVSIPVILHLLKRKRRPIQWGAMRFLEEAYRKRRRVITLEQLLLLALRCLLIILIALGVGSLMLGSGLARSVPTTLVIVLDDSIGSALEVDGVRELDRNKALAMAALDELDAGTGDQAALISMSSPASGVLLPESNDLGAVRAMIEAAEPTDAPADLTAALALTRELGADPQRATRTAVLIAGSARGAPQTPDADEGSTPISPDQLLAASPATQALANTGIASAVPTRSLVTESGIALPVGVRVGLIRSGLTSAGGQTPVRVENSDGETIGQRALRWEPGETTVSGVIALDAGRIDQAGGRAGLLRVGIGEDANPRDNTRLLTLPVRSRLRVGVIDRAGEARTQPGAGREISPSRWVRAALAPGENSGIEIVSIEARRAGSLLTPKLDALILLAPEAVDQAGWDRIAQLRETGALLLITPDARAASSSWIERLREIDETLVPAGASPIEHQPPLALTPEIPDPSVLSGIGAEAQELARAVQVFRSIPLNPRAEAAAILSDGSALAVQSRQSNGRGPIIVFAAGFDLDWTNLPARPMFVAMLQEMVRQGVGIGSSMPMIEAGERLDAPAWSRSSRRVAIGAIAPEPDAGVDDTRFAGVVAHLDAQGAIRELAVINPDASGARADTVARDAYASLLDELIDAPEIEWADRSAPVLAGEPERTDLLGPDAPSVSIALWMLMAAGVVAVLEFVLAKFFTARLLGREAMPRMGGLS